METKPKAVLEPSGRIVLTGPELTEFLGEVGAVELWHSPTNKGLAINCLPEASPGSRPISPGEMAGQYFVETADFLAKVGFELPAQAMELGVGAIDEDRKVITLSLAQSRPDGRRFAPGEILAGLED